MRFKTQPWGAEFLTLQKPCQVIGIRGFLKYAFVWSVDDDGVFGIHEFTTGNFIASGHTLDQAQKMLKLYFDPEG